MDAKKTGRFISQVRKELGLTQKDLAQKLNVSDKAISRWETGKGFPDTSLLKPLSDALGINVGELLSGERLHEANIRDGMDNIIVDSLHSARKKTARLWIACAVLGLIAVIIAGLLIVPALLPISAIDFVNRSQTTMHYSLADDNTRFQITYSDFEKTEFENGYEYATPDGTRRYVFTSINDLSSQPVLSYLHISSSGSLFGIQIGEETYIKPNPTLGIPKTSLIDYLKENGFQWHDAAEDFGRPNLVYIDGERCNWMPFTKDNVFINICISAYEGRRLLAFDIGLIDSSMNTYFSQMLAGYPITIDDPYDLITSQPQLNYRPWDTVTITAKVTQGAKSLYLYLNGEFYDKFSPALTGEYEIRFSMPEYPITVTVTPEELAE